MIITQFDHPTTAEEARQISLANKEDSKDRHEFRNLMNNILCSASFGSTRYQTMPRNSDFMPSEHVCKVLRSMGYAVTHKRAYLWDQNTGKWSDKPWLDTSGREQYLTEITWG